MAEALSLLLFAGGATVTIAALLVVLGYLLPTFVGRSRRALESMPIRSLLVGIVNAIFFMAIAGLILILGAELPDALRGLFNLAALAILLALLGMAALGLAGLLTLLRDRVGLSPSSLPALLWLGVLLVAAGLAPVIGWLALTPLALLAGLGAAIIALVQRGAQK
jgi:hypothetical protein